MFQGDPKFRGLNSEVMQKDSADILGMEAKSILRSIQTEHSKLVQSAALSHSDLHYFRARYNYYRLSLLRLEDSERQSLQKALNLFRSQIAEAEIGGKTSNRVEESAPAPFLEEVTAKAARPEIDCSSESIIAVERDEFSEVKTAVPANTPALQKTGEPKKEAILSELNLLQIALSAEASNDRNSICSQAISRLIQKVQDL